MPGGYGTVGTPWGSSGSTYTPTQQTKPASSYSPPSYSSSGGVTDWGNSWYPGVGNPSPEIYNAQNSGGNGSGSGTTLGDLFKGLGFTSGGMEGFGNMMTGVGGLAQGWGALKDAKLAREAFAQQQKQWEMNYESQRLVTNNAIANQNAWKQAQGRTDYGSYVGGKPSGTNYIG